MTAQRAHLDLADHVRITIDGPDTDTVLAMACNLRLFFEATGPSTPRPIPGEEGRRTWLFARLPTS